eukprot:4506259-Alexandrium_andersonii.AAC.1
MALRPAACPTTLLEASTTRCTWLRGMQYGIIVGGGLRASMVTATLPTCWAFRRVPPPYRGAACPQPLQRCQRQ